MVPLFLILCGIWFLNSGEVLKLSIHRFLSRVYALSVEVLRHCFPVYNLEKVGVRG